VNLKSIFWGLAGFSVSLAALDSPPNKETEIDNSIATKKEIVQTQTELEINQIQVNSNLTQEVAYRTKSNIRFICGSGYDRESGERFPTTYAWTPRGKIAIVRWKFPWFESKEWTNESRCEAVSSRFQEAYDNGSMLYFTNGRQNNQDVVCTAYKDRGDCVTMLFTLRPQDDPIATVRDLTDILNGRGTTPVQNSSGKKQVYFKITNIDKFLAIAPVEKE